MFDARLLTTFIAVAHHRHFGKAALAVNATQPGVSQQIAKLERQLGFKLIERTKRSVALTPAGESLYANSRHLLSMLDKMKEEGIQISKGMFGTISLGMASSIIHSNIPKKISTFKSDNPNIDIKIIVEPADQLKRMLINGVIEAAITTVPMPSNNFDTAIISKQIIGVAVPLSHPLSKMKSVKIKQLLNDKFIVVPREYDPVRHDTLLSRFRSLGVSVQISAYEIPSFYALARVSVGEGITLIPFGYVSENNDSVRILQLDDPELSQTPIYAITRKDDANALIRRFLAAMS